MPFKLLRSPSSTTTQSRNSRLSFNFFFFATGDTQKDSGLEIEFMLDTGASSSIINYRNCWEICQTQHPISVTRSTIQTKTYSGQVVPMIGLATLTFIYDPDGQFTFPLTVWITEMKTQNLLGMDFCQKQVSGIHFELPGIELKEPPDTVCYGSLHRNKAYPFISRILTIRTPHAMHIDAKSARCWKYSHEDSHAHFPPGSTFQPNRNAVATGLSFVKVLCTQSESKLPILMENNKNHQITLPKGRIGFSSLDICDKDEPRMTARGKTGRALLSTKGELAPHAYGQVSAWSNWYCGPFDLALAPLRCAPLRLSAMTYGGPLVCRLYYFFVATKNWFDETWNNSFINELC